jgi:hypothetical protein
MLNLFYTRAIQNIDYGVNYTYRSNKLKAGLVYVEEEKDIFGNKRKFFIARPNFNSPKLNFGSFFIYSDDKTNNYQDKILSLDGKISLPLRFKFSPQIVTNFSNDKLRNAYHLHLYYEFNSAGGPYGDLIYTRFDNKFNALTLFNDYGDNYDEIFAGYGYKFVRNNKYFSDMNFFTSYYRAKTLTGNFTHQESGSVSFYHKTLSWLSFYHELQLNFPDENANGTIAHRKNFLQEHNVKFLIGPNALLFGYFFGPYYGTYLKNPYANLDLSFFEKLGVNISYSHREEDIVQSIYRIKLDYKILEKLYLRSFYQISIYHNQSDKNNTLWNTLLQYEFFAGSNIYFVLNLSGKELENTGRYFKIGYEFNF